MNETQCGIKELSVWRMSHRHPEMDGISQDVEWDHSLAHVRSELGETPISKGPIAKEKQCRITEAKRIGILKERRSWKESIKYIKKKSIKIRTGKCTLLRTAAGP